MKKTSARKFSGIKSKKSSKQKISWFGIDVYRIGLGVAFVGSIVSFLLVQKQQSLEPQTTQVLASESHFPRLMEREDITGSQSARPNCIPRPQGFDTTATISGRHTMIMYFCQPSSVPTPFLTPPHGCFYKRVCLMNPCTEKGNGKCEACKNSLICPKGMPFRQGTSSATACIPRPSCLRNEGSTKCYIAEPEHGWCPSEPKPTCIPQPT